MKKVEVENINDKTKIVFDDIYTVASVFGVSIFKIYEWCFNIQENKEFRFRILD